MYIHTGIQCKQSVLLFLMILHTVLLLCMLKCMHSAPGVILGILACLGVLYFCTPGEQQQQQQQQQHVAWCGAGSA
jgi:hypothetical protein